jgi:CheY-like chemotaxis protein
MLKRQEVLQLLRTIVRDSEADMSESIEGANLVFHLTIGPDLELLPPSTYSDIPLPERRYRVLHVEDIGRTADLVFYYLRNHYDVDTVETATEGFEEAMKILYDFILVDLNLGDGMGGLQLTELLRKTERYAKTPIIAVTGFATRKDVDNSMAAGCSAFLSKPFLKSDLLRILQQLEERMIKPPSNAAEANR